MSNNIHGVLFDFGDTLMYPQASWPPVFERASHRLGEYLAIHDKRVDCSSIPTEFRQRLGEYFIERERSMIETSSMAVLQNLLAEKGFVHLNEAFLREALDQYYAVTQQNWLLEEDAIPTLEALKAAQIRIGLVSNASDSRDVQSLVEKFGIQSYLDFVLTSADCSYRKPHPRIFELALSNWGYLPDEIAMVGDRLDADISGARPLGIYTIWIKRRAARKAAPGSAQPDAIVNTLGEIPALLRDRFW